MTLLKKPKGSLLSEADLVNQNGHRLCERYGCRKHTKLKSIFGGVFCKKHAEELAKIRTRIGRLSMARALVTKDRPITDGSLLEEIRARLIEFRLRKTDSPGHLKFVWNVLDVLAGRLSDKEQRRSIGEEILIREREQEERNKWGRKIPETTVIMTLPDLPIELIDRILSWLPSCYAPLLRAVCKRFVSGLPIPCPSKGDKKLRALAAQSPNLLAMLRALRFPDLGLPERLVGRLTREQEFVQKIKVTVIHRWDRPMILHLEAIGAVTVVDLLETCLHLNRYDIFTWLHEQRPSVRLQLTVKHVIRRLEKASLNGDCADALEFLEPFAQGWRRGPVGFTPMDRSLTFAKKCLPRCFAWSVDPSRTLSEKHKGFTIHPDEGRQLVPGFLRQCWSNFDDGVEPGDSWAVDTARAIWNMQLTDPALPYPVPVHIFVDDPDLLDFYLDVIEPAQGDFFRLHFLIDFRRMLLTSRFSWPALWRLLKRQHPILSVDWLWRTVFEHDWSNDELVIEPDFRLYRQLLDAKFLPPWTDLPEDAWPLLTDPQWKLFHGIERHGMWPELPYMITLTTWRNGLQSPNEDTERFEDLHLAVDLQKRLAARIVRVDPIAECAKEKRLVDRHGFRHREYGDFKTALETREIRIEEWLNLHPDIRTVLFERGIRCAMPQPDTRDESSIGWAGYSGRTTLYGLGVDIPPERWYSYSEPLRAFLSEKCGYVEKPEWLEWQDAHDSRIDPNSLRDRVLFVDWIRMSDEKRRALADRDLLDMLELPEPKKNDTIAE